MGLFNEMLAGGLTVNAHQAHGNTADGYPGVPWTQEIFAVGAEAPEKQKQPAEIARDQPDSQIDVDVRRHVIFVGYVTFTSTTRRSSSVTLNSSCGWKFIIRAMKTSGSCWMRML